MSLAAKAEAERKRRLADPERNREAVRRWKLKNREKKNAHKAVLNAIQTGRLKRQPCERCGTKDRVHAHHDDYEKRFDVMWLCPVHHKERHKELRSQ